MSALLPKAAAKVTDRRGS